MKKPLRVALVGAGQFSGSPLSHVPGLAEHLGPVKAPSFRVASRIANSLRGGTAVNRYEDFAECALILINVPDALAPEIAAELACSELTWKDKAVVLCSDRLDAGSLAGLARLGAITGSLSVVPGFEDSWLLLEGGKPVEREMRPLIKRRGVRITVVAEGSKARYLDGLDRLGRAFVPQVRDALESMRAAGISNAQAFAILEKQAARTMRSCFRSGKS